MTKTLKTQNPSPSKYKNAETPPPSTPNAGMQNQRLRNEESMEFQVLQIPYSFEIFILLVASNP
jgi:hypothetical protein